MTEYILSYDFGNRLIKGKNNQASFDFDHICARLAPEQLDKLQQDGDDKDVFVINRTPYMFGKRALRYGAQFAEGAHRYTPEYYERFLGRMLWQMYPKNRKDIVLFAGHAPRDIQYRDDIKYSSTGTFFVEHRGEKRQYRIKDTHCWHEPLGGIMMQMLTADGQAFRNEQYENKQMLVIDIGGLTIDYILVEDAVPDYLSARSYTDRNIIDAVDEFEQLLRKNYPQCFKNRNDVAQDRLHSAIHTNKFDAGARGIIECKKEVDHVCEEIVNSVQSMYQIMGGESLHYVLLTGGGSALLEQRIRNRLMIDGVQRKGIHIAYDRKELHMANVYGAHKLALFYHAQGKM